MRARFLGKDPQSQEGQSPTLFATDRTDRVTYIAQGWKVTDPTNAAGEDIRYLARHDATGLPDYDYWLFDSSGLVRMHFDDDENFLGGELIEDPAVIVQHNYGIGHGQQRVKLRQMRCLPPCALLKSSTPSGNGSSASA